MSAPAPPPPSRPRFATASLVEPILQEVARSLLEEKSALFASSSFSSSSSSSSAASAASAAAESPPPDQFLLRYPRYPRDAQAFASELSQRVLSRLAGLALPCKWAASCSLAARAGGGAAAAAAGVFEGEEEEEEEEEEGEEEQEGGGEDEKEDEKDGKKGAATGPRLRLGGDSLCSVLVEEGGVALTVTAAWVRGL